MPKKSKPQDESSTPPVLKTFAFRSENGKLIKAMQRGFEALVKHQPDEWESHLYGIFASLEMCIKTKTYSHWHEAVGMLGAQAVLRKMSMLAEGTIDDDCDCMFCQNRRKVGELRKSPECNTTSETFQRYYVHLSLEASHDEEIVIPWKEAFAEWEQFSPEQKLLTCEAIHWSYYEHEQEQRKKARKSPFGSTPEEN